ncbi:hypothetical protein [Pseudomonas sp. PA27(2017)]|uniref:hypothetical protein n=1 Tax=Pseudomonas sp. PA27(2017) TaxID=1932112 RepID=UPI00096366BF|nr:hypothetical protein [Pseudomonas sp. PA27(2017)]OLU33796.1 hypothetical protein BVH06_07485 [Pseudomonas sp. PA27(2017)]
MLIAILGASGDIGHAVALALLRLGHEKLRLGGRDAKRGQRSVARLQERFTTVQVHWQVADAEQPASLAAFAHGCALLVNCAGPAWQIADKVARAAELANCDYLDVAADSSLLERLDDRQWQRRGRRALLGAGLMPGLTGWLPRWLVAQELTRVVRLNSYLGVRAFFTEVAANDFLHSAVSGDNEALAAWRGRRCSRVLTRRDNPGLPGFPPRSRLLPALDQEAERLARDLQLEQGNWYSVIEDGYVLAALDQAHARPRNEAVKALCEASRLDLSGRDEFVSFLLVVSGWKDESPMARSLLLNGSSNAALSGAFAAVTALAMIEHSLPSGCHLAAEILPVKGSLERLLQTGACQAPRLTANALDEPQPVEEGCL